MGEEGRQCVFCFDVAGKQGGTMAGVQSTRVSLQARVPASRVNQVTLARGLLPSRVRVYSHLDVLHAIIRAKPLYELTAVRVAFTAELSLQILSFLEQVWIDAY